MRRAYSLHTVVQIDGLVQERCNSIANALELRLSCTKPSKCCLDLTCYFRWTWWHAVHRLNHHWYINGLVQERRNSSALAMELRLSCTNPSKSHLYNIMAQSTVYMPSKSFWRNILFELLDMCEYISVQLIMINHANNLVQDSVISIDYAWEMPQYCYYPYVCVVDEQICWILYFLQFLASIFPWSPVVWFQEACSVLCWVSIYHISQPYSGWVTQSWCRLTAGRSPYTHE